MRKGILILTMVLACSVSLGAEAANYFAVKAVYQNRDGSVSEQDWQITMERGQVRIGDTEREHCVLDVQQGNIVRITAWKRNRGTFRKFVLNEPFQIRLELETSFYPYEVVVDRLKGEKSQRRDWVVGTTMFRIVHEEK